MDEALAVVVAAPPDGYSEVCPALPDGSARVGSLDALEPLLRQVAAEVPRPVLATVIRGDGDQLSIGLGGPESFLTYVPKDGMPPYFNVLGDGPEDDEVCFDYNGEPSFYSASNTVSFELALEVARRFVMASGLPLPDLVAWEEV